MSENLNPFENFNSVSESYQSESFVPQFYINPYPNNDQDQSKIEQDADGNQLHSLLVDFFPQMSNGQSQIRSENLEE